MRFLSVCSGIEAASVAWSPLGWSAVAFAEIEPFPCAVLAHHYPDVPNWGDMTKYKEWPDVSIDLLCGGTPCQSFSVAGLRKGLDDPRGNLMLTFGAIAARYRPKWLVFENVPGLLSADGGRAFGSFLGMLGLIGYGFAYRILDAQYTGLAQRRKRVFVVGCAGDWRSAAAVLFERHSLSGHPAPRREKGKAAPTIPSRSTAGGGLGTDFDCDGGVIVDWPHEVAGTLDAHYGDKMGLEDQHVFNQRGSRFVRSATPVAFDTTQVTSAANRSNPKAGDPCRPLAAGMHPPAIAFNWQGGGTQTTLGYDPSAGHTGALHAGQVPAIAFGTKEFAQDAGDVSPPLRAMGSSKDHPNGGGQVGVAYSITPSNSNKDYNAREVEKAQALTAGGNRPSARGGDLIAGMQVRRLIPEECEALQGFPRGYTAIPYRNKKAPDGPRYKALGNSWAVPCAAWIGERIAQVEAIHDSASSTDGDRLA